MLSDDFSIKVKDEEDSDTINFLDFLDTFNLENKINFLTHRVGNTLDIIGQQ